MADQDWNGLPYGHFGNAFYQSEEQTWRFERVPDQPRILEPIEGSEVAVPSQISPSSVPTKIAPNPAGPAHIVRDKQIAELLNLVPNLQPAASLLRPLLGASEAIEDATRHHDPVKGQLLSFGRVFDESIRCNCRNRAGMTAEMSGWKCLLSLVKRRFGGVKARLYSKPASRSR
jgi:hypothetical protein